MGGPVNNEYGTCPECAAQVPLTPRRKQVKKHDSDGKLCPGSFKQPVMWTPPKRWPLSGWPQRKVRGLLVAVISLLSAVAGLLGYFGISGVPPLSWTPDG